MAKQIKTDEEFKLQRQARRRLIGAVALMLAIVVFLPMVFDSDPGVSVGNVELRIPDKNEAPAFRVEAANQPVVPAAESVVASAVSAEPAVSAVAAPVVPAVTVPKTPAPTPKTPASIKSEPKPQQKAAAVPPSGWVLQVGAYSKEDAGRQMQENLKKRGYPAYTEKVAGMLRVRVGGYPSREAAEKVKQKLEAIGLLPNVISPE